MKKIHYAWVILIVCALLFSFTAGTLINCNGIFNTAICQDTGWKYADYIVSNLFYGIGSMATLLFVNRIYKLFSMKWVIAAASVVFAASYAFRAYATSISAFSMINFVSGMSGAFLIYVPIPVLIKRWFVKLRAFALGIAMMVSGLAGSIASPILVSWIELYGWRKAAFMNGIISAVILFPTVALFLVDRPSDKGMKALGADDSLEHDTADAKLQTPKEQQVKAVAAGDTSAKDALKKKRTYKFPAVERNVVIKVLVCLIFAFFTQLFATFYNQFTNIAVDYNYGLVFGGALVSVSLAFNMLSKSIQGICMDRFGKKRVILISLALVGTGFVVLLFNGGNKIMLYISAATAGWAAANSTMVTPLLVDTFAKGEDYVKHYSTVTYGTYIAAMLTAYIPGILREASGSYELISGIYAFSSLLCIGIVVWLLSGKEWAA